MNSLTSDPSEYLPIETDADGNGPADPEDALRTVCWICIAEDWPCRESRNTANTRRHCGHQIRLMTTDRQWVPLRLSR